MKTYRLKKWYPSLPKDWEEGMKVIETIRYNINIYENADNKYKKLCIDKKNVENNPEFWEQLFYMVDSFQIIEITYNEIYVPSDPKGKFFDSLKEAKKYYDELEKACENCKNTNNYKKELKALKKLLIERDKIREGWKPDWEDNKSKHILYIYKNQWKAIILDNAASIFSFQTANKREEFYNNFKDLLEKIKPLCK